MIKLILETNSGKKVSRKFPDRNSAISFINEKKDILAKATIVESIVAEAAPLPLDNNPAKLLASIKSVASSGNGKVILNKLSELLSSLAGGSQLSEPEVGGDLASRNKAALGIS